MIDAALEKLRQDYCVSLGSVPQQRRQDVEADLISELFQEPALRVMDINPGEWDSMVHIWTLRSKDTIGTLCTVHWPNGELTAGLVFFGPEKAEVAGQTEEGRHADTIPSRS